MAGFFAMGGYAAYVWPAYGVSLAAIAGLIAAALLEYRRARARLAALESEPKERS